MGIVRFALRFPHTYYVVAHRMESSQARHLGGRSSSVIVAGQAQGAKVVKTFNSPTMANFEKGPTEGNGRRVLFASGDDRSAKQLVSDLITSFGYAVIDLGDLDDGGRFQQPGGPRAGKDLLLASWSQNDRSAVQMHGQVTMSGRLKGKVSLVTGGELGAATAKALAEQGATFNSLRA